MYSWKIFIYVEFAFLYLIGNESNSQGLTLEKWIGKQFLQSSLIRNLNHEKIRSTHELDYTLAVDGLFLKNYQQSHDVNQAGINQNLKFLYSIDNGDEIKLTNSFIHNLGFRYFFDSIVQVNVDDNTLITRLEFSLFQKINITFNSNLTSRFLNGFDYMINDSGQQVKILNSAFMTPLIWTFSWGVGYSWVKFGSLNLGITGGKLTYIRERKIFDIQKVNSFYGIEKGKNHLFEYGMSFQLQIDKDLCNFLHWNFDLLLFKNYQMPIDMTFKNLFGIKINKFLKTSLSTKILYEEKLNKHLQFENLLSIGFNIHL